jgi:EAL and modified HD-GYP domain-containing signal transduction protein
MDAFIARQPILDRNLTVRGYELLFRSGLQNLFEDTDPELATSKVISGSLLLPTLDTVSGGKTVFINLTRELLVQEVASLLPARTTVLELLETITPDPEVLRACRRLKGMGYRIALDDYRADPALDPLVDLADIVKVDLLATPPAEIASIAGSLPGRGILLVAEKVETQEAFQEMQSLGYHLFQGYFFARPTIVSGRDIPASTASCLQLLQEIHKPDMDFRQIRDTVEHEVALSYKLLRYINSAFFGRRGSVSSIQHALLLLGESETRRWATVVALAGLSDEEPGELLSMALLRGRLCELLAPAAHLPTRASDVFLVGLFSLIDAILQYPLEKILHEIPIASDAKAALLGEPGPIRDMLDLATAYSTADWDSVAAAAARLGIREEWLPAFYEAAIEWSQQGLQGARTARAA